MTSVKPDFDVAAGVYPDPQKLYIKDEFYQESPYKYYRGPFLGCIFGCGVHLGNNWIRDRPFRAGIQKYFFFGGIGTVAGYFLSLAAIQYFAHRDQVYKHYIALHPEDFPPPKKVKLAEKFDPWVPTR